MPRPVAPDEDAIVVAIGCLGLERRGSAFIERIWNVLRAAILSGPPPEPTWRHGSIHTECPFNALTMRSWAANSATHEVDPTIAAKLRPMVLLGLRDEMISEAPEHVGQVVGLSCMYCYASYDDASSMETLRGLRDLDTLAADPTYGRDTA